MRRIYVTNAACWLALKFMWDTLEIEELAPPRQWRMDKTYFDRSPYPNILAAGRNDKGFEVFEIRKAYIRPDYKRVRFADKQPAEVFAQHNRDKGFWKVGVVYEEYDNA